MLSMVAELDSEGRFRKSANPRTMLEALLLRWAFLERTVEVETLLRAAGGGATSPLAGSAADTPRATSLTGILERLDTSPATAPPRAATAAGAGAADAGGATAAAAGAAAASRPRAAATAADAVADTAAATTAADALRTMLEQQRAPQGLGIFLKAARIAGESGDDVVIALPPGPGLEHLSGNLPAAREVQDVMSELMGRSIRLAVRSTVPDHAAVDGETPAAPAAEPATGQNAAHGGGRRRQQRITPETVRAERLARIAGSDAAVLAAVKEWDLELLE
jgi:DNA polymerase-3 subunit gamma/tau